VRRISSGFPAFKIRDHDGAGVRFLQERRLKSGEVKLDMLDVSGPDGDRWSALPLLGFVV